MSNIKEKLQVRALIKSGLDKESAEFLIKNKSINPDEVNHLLSIAHNPVVSTPTNIIIPNQTKDGNFIRRISKSAWLDLCRQTIKFIKSEVNNEPNY